LKNILFAVENQMVMVKALAFFASFRAWFREKMQSIAKSGTIVFYIDLKPVAARKCAAFSTLTYLGEL